MPVIDPGALPQPVTSAGGCKHPPLQAPLAPSARGLPTVWGDVAPATEGPGPEGLRPQAVGERTLPQPHTSADKYCSPRDHAAIHIPHKEPP